MARKATWWTLVGLVSILLVLPDGVQAAQETLSTPKFLDRAKLSESMWNLGLQGGGYDGGLVGLITNPLMYPHIWSGNWNGLPWRYGSYGNPRSMDHDCSKGQGVWILAKDSDGNVYVTSSGPRFVSDDVEIDLPSIAPGGNLALSNGEDHPYVKAQIGYNGYQANAWYNSDVGGGAQYAPLSEEPLEISNYRRNGQYTEAKFDHFPEEIIVTRWKSNGASQGTGMTMTRHAYAWSHQDFDDLFLIELSVENTSGRDYEEVYIGYMNYFDVSKPGHSLSRWAGWFAFNDPNRGLEDEKLQFTEASNYTGTYAGKVVSYHYDGNNPRSGHDDTANPALAAIIGRGSYAHYAPGELTSPQYVGWGPVDLVPPFINDPETYVPITGSEGASEILPGVPAGQPAYFRWFKATGRQPKYDPNKNLHTPDEMYNMLITPTQPHQPLPVDGGPTPEEEELQAVLHTNHYGPYRLQQGEKAKIVVAFAAGHGAEYAGANGEPMEDRYWRMTPAAMSQVTDGEKALMNHMDRARQLYRMGYDVPNQPPDAQSDARLAGRTTGPVTDRSLLKTSSPTGHTVLTWTDGADTAVNPDWGDQDLAGYAIYYATTLPSDDPQPHLGLAGGPWWLAGKVPKGTGKSGNTYSFEHKGSVTGFNYWYTIASYGNGHDTWTNTNAQANAIPGAQAPEVTTLSDLPAIVQAHVKAGLEGSHLHNEARDGPNGEWYAPAVAAANSFDSLSEQILVVPNPWKDDGIHSYGGAGSNDTKMRFTGIPRLCRILIYNAAGDLVFEMVHDGTQGSQHVGEINWTQQARGGMGYAGPGIYFYAVESLVPETMGKTKTGTFVIVK